MQYILNLIDGSDYRIYSKNLDTMVDTLLATHPTDSLAIKLAGSWDMATGRDSLARNHFNDLIRLYPDNPTGWIILMAMESEKESKISIGEEALKHIKKTPKEYISTRTLPAYIMKQGTKRNASTIWRSQKNKAALLHDSEQLRLFSQSGGQEPEKGGKDVP